VAAVLAARNRHRVPVVEARYHHCVTVMTEHNAKQATHVTNMQSIATNCLCAKVTNPSKEGGHRYDRPVRTAVVTGGSSGIGLAVARRLARRGGWQILLAGRRAGPLAAAAAELGATAVECDVTDDDGVARLVEAAEAAGGCDLLVHAAGAPARAHVLEADLSIYRWALETNYIGLVRVATAFWPLLEASRGRLVPVVSVAGTVALAPSAPYAAAIVNPGPVQTPGFPQTALLRSRWGRLLVVDAERCAERLLAAADRRSPEVFVPHWWRVATALQGAAPALTARVAARAWRHEPRPPAEAAPA
jgi:hypothetical protein